MKQSEKFIYHTCAYTVLISVLFFLFARILSLNELSISLLRYFTIFAFSLIISAAEYIFTFKKIPKFSRYILHYLVLCFAFCVVFLTVQNTSGEYEFNASSVFAAIVLFSIIYFLIACIVLLTFKFVNKSRKKNDERSEKKSDYKSRFKPE